jgi:hypothetical protein
MPSFTVPAFTLYDAGGNPITSRSLGNDTPKYLDVVAANGDRSITGAVTGTANNNILLAVAGAGSLDCFGFSSMTVQLIKGAGVTGGTILFEGCNDDTNFKTLATFKLADFTGNSTTITIQHFLSGADDQYYVPLIYRYNRFRISSAATGGSANVQAFTYLSSQAWEFPMPMGIRSTHYTGVLVESAQRIDIGYNGTVATDFKYALFSRNTSGDGTAIVNLVSGFKIRVINVVWVSSGTVTAKWQSGSQNTAGGTNVDITGDMDFTTQTGVGNNSFFCGAFQTTISQALKLNLSANIKVAGFLTYMEI